MRVLEKNWELREFSLFGAVAFACNGRLPDDLEQRSIIIEMQRRRVHEELAELRDDHAESLQQIARMCAHWADDNAHLLADHDPDMGMINRNADNWRPLFAIADVIGEDWPTRIREAAAVLAPRESESIGPMLLADIRATFDERGVDRLASVELCEALAVIEGRPWADWKAGKPLTSNQLARLLKPFHIISDSVRIGIRTPKGYYRHQFAEAFERYLAAEGINEPQHRNNAHSAGTSATFQNATPDPDVAFQKCKKPAPDGVCCDVADRKWGEAIADRDDRSCRQCDGTLDGSEQPYDIDGAQVWLHPECRRFYLVTTKTNGIEAEPGRDRLDS
jgi:hypothetical protein